MNEDIYHGTTTIGIICEDGVVMATDSRATMGGFISNSNAKKVYKVGERIAMTTAGSVGDAQQLVKYMSIEAKMYKVSREHSMSVKAAANQLANVLRGNRLYPFSVQLLLGGCDTTGPSLYSLDAIGGLLEEEYYCATGSGSPIAYGVLESQYAKGIRTDEALVLAIRALKTAMKRDSASGSTVQAVIMTMDEYNEVDTDEINYIIGDML